MPHQRKGSSAATPGALPSVTLTLTDEQVTLLGVAIGNALAQALTADTSGPHTFTAALGKRVGATIADRLIGWLSRQGATPASPVSALLGRFALTLAAALGMPGPDHITRRVPSPVETS